jgi:hypothetical protein
MEKWIALEYVEVVFSLLPSFLAAAARDDVWHTKDNGG